MQENQRDSVNSLLGNGLFGGGGGGGLDLFKLLRALLRRAWAVVMVGVVFAAAGYFFAKSGRRHRQGRTGHRCCAV